MKVYFGYLLVTIMLLIVLSNGYWVLTSKEIIVKLFCLVSFIVTLPILMEMTVGVITYQVRDKEDE